MADTKISNLAALAAAPDTNDVFALVDTTAGSTKKLEAKYLVRDSGGSGAIVTGAFTLTLPATGTAALLATANTFTANQTITGILDWNAVAAGSRTGHNRPGISVDSAVTVGSLSFQLAGVSAPSFAFINAGYSATLVEIKNSGNVLIGTATDSGKLTVNGEIALVDGMTEPGTTSGWAKLYVDDDGGDLKIKFGNGTVKTIVVDE